VFETFTKVGKYFIISLIYKDLREFLTTIPFCIINTLKNKDICYLSFPWHCLYFLPEPHEQGSLRPIFFSVLLTVAVVSSSEELKISSGRDKTTSCSLSSLTSVFIVLIKENTFSLKLIIAANSVVNEYQIKIEELTKEKEQ